MTHQPASTLAAPELEPLRFSRLKLMGKSAAHFQAGFGGETGAMRKGTALHSYMLGGADKVVLYEGGARNPKFKVWQDFQAANDGKHILIPSEMAAVEGMRASLEAHPRALDLLDGIQEQRIDWTDSGRACRGTPDAVHLLPGGRKIGVELKTCVTSHPERFQWQSRKMSYHAQCAWYKHGLERSMVYPAGPVTEFFIVAVESTAPYPVTVFRLDEESLSMGHEQNRLWLEQLLGCERTGHFPAYTESDVTLTVLEGGDGLDWGAAG